MEPNEVNIPRWYLPSFNKQSVIKKIRDIIGSTPISVSFDDIENKPTTLAGYGITDAVNINSVGTATWKDYVDVIDRYGTNLPTESAVYSLVNTMITAAQSYQGASSTEITNGGNQLPTIGGQVYTPKLGDIVAYNNKEFVWESTNTWRELGDEGSYALKTISVWAGTGLTGGGDLSTSRTLSLSDATQTDIGQGVTAYGWGNHANAGYVTDTTGFKYRGDYSATAGAKPETDQSLYTTNNELCGSWTLKFSGSSGHLFQSYASGSASYIQLYAYYPQTEPLRWRVSQDRNLNKPWREIYDNLTSYKIQLINYAGEASGYRSLAAGASAYAKGDYSSAFGYASQAGLRSGDENKPYVYMEQYTPEAITYNGSTVYGIWLKDNATATFTYNGTQYSVTTPSTTANSWRVLNVVKITGDILVPQTSSYYWRKYYVITDTGLAIGDISFEQVTKLENDLYALVSYAVNTADAWKDERPMSTSATKIGLWTKHSSTTYSGVQTSTIGAYSVSYASRGIALGGHSVAGINSITLGYDSMAKGSNSMAGSYAVATGSNSLALGSFSSTISDGAVALGYISSAKGVYSLATGYRSLATSGYAMALGAYSKAQHEGAFVQAFKGLSGANFQTVLGIYNQQVSGQALVVGWGTADNDRKNIMTLSTAGALTLASGLNLSGSIGFDSTTSTRYASFVDSSNVRHYGLSFNANGNMTVGESLPKDGKNLTVYGNNIYLGFGYANNATAHNIYFTSSGYVLPQGDIDFGAASSRWHKIWVNEIDASGDITLDASSTDRYIKGKFASNIVKDVLRLHAVDDSPSYGQLFIGDSTISGTYLTGKSVYLQSYNFSTSTTNRLIFSGNAIFYPNVDNAYELGRSDRRFAKLYATTLYGNLALSYLTGADDLKAIEALTGTSGFLKKTAANTWALDTAPDASTLNGKTAAEILSGVESLKTTSEEDAMFTYRKTPSVAVGDMAKLLKIKGKTIVWNQKVNMKAAGDYSTANVTITIAVDGKLTISGTANANVNIIISDTSFLGISGHKYYLHGPSVANNGCYIQYAAIGRYASSGDEIYTSTSGTDGYCNLRITSGATTNWSGYIQAIDLTQAGLDSITSVAEFEALYSLNNYNYDSGSLQSNRVASIESVGWNQWDEEWELGRISTTTGQDILDANYIRSKNYIQVFAGLTYYFNIPAKVQGGSYMGYLYYYDAEKNFISYVSIGPLYYLTQTIPAGVAFARLQIRSEYGTTYNHDICINLSNPDRNGEYQPYKKDTLEVNVTDLVPVDKPTLRFNQRILNGNFSNSTTNWSFIRSTTSLSDGVLTVTPTATDNTASAGAEMGVTSTVNHYYYRAVVVKGNSGVGMQFGGMGSGVSFDGSFITGNWQRLTDIKKCTTADAYTRILQNTDASLRPFYIKSYICIDLTEMYGSGNEPTSTAEVEALIGTDYIPYNTGEDIPNRIFPQGERGAGTACDLAYGNTAEDRLLPVDLGTLTWTRNTSQANVCYISNALDIKAATGWAVTYDNIICSKFLPATPNEASGIGGKTDVISVTTTNKITICPSTSYSTAAEFKAAMNGVIAYVERKTPKTYTIAPLPQLIASDPDGTQRRLPEDTASSVSAPMVCDFQYGVNPRDLYSEEKSEIADVRNAISDILTQLPSSGKAEIPTETPASPENTKTYIYYDDVAHKICVREKDGTVYSVQLTT